MAFRISQQFGANGPLARALPSFTPRAQQAAVAEAVESALGRTGDIALIEAGTGVGKTLAYLVPALRRARPDRKIIISTHTLALQAQLAERDVPFVQSLSPQPPEAAVVKGRGNYLCLQDYDAARADLWTAGDPQFAQIGRWGQSSETGDVGELDFTYPQWGDIRANPDTCKGQECRFFDRCFYYRMRRAAQEASVLLVNHALFFSDLALRAGTTPDARLLPDYDFVIFDEAHHLETAAAGAFGIAFSSARLPALLDKVRRAARSLDIDTDRLKAIGGAADSLFAPFRQAGRPEFFVHDILPRDTDMEQSRGQVAIIGTLLDTLALELLKQDTQGLPALKDRIDGLRRQCVRAKEELSLLFGSDNPNFVRWGSLGRAQGRAPFATLNWTPISVAPLLAEALWKEPRGVGAALISATLSTDGGFGYLRERLGLPAAMPSDDISAAASTAPAPARSRKKSPVTLSKTTLSKAIISETIVGSPFDYPRNCLLYIPRALPPPSDTPAYAAQAAEEMLSLLDASGGGAFVLFTSHRALNTAYEALTQSDLPYALLRQGEMPNARLVEAFKQERNGVLLGTQSFWEGVDVPGAGLRLVIIDRIPFAVPDSPLHKARVDGITEAGGDWFGEFALPQAQLKLKQGFGRLIRTATDRGVVAILDTRLVRKTYGQRFLRFLPPAPRTSDIDDVRAFYASHPLQKEALLSP